METGSGSQLSALQQQTLIECEDLYTSGLDADFDKGTALERINRGRLYKDYGSFPKYCEIKWQVSESHAYRLIDCARVVIAWKSSPNWGALPVPRRESHVRELVGLPQADVISAWTKVVEDAAGSRITAKQVKEAVTELRVQRGYMPAPKPTSPPARARITREMVIHWYRWLLYATRAISNEDYEEATQLVERVAHEIGNLSVCPGAVIYTEYAAVPDYEI